MQSTRENRLLVYLCLQGGSTLVSTLVSSLVSMPGGLIVCQHASPPNMCFIDVDIFELNVRAEHFKTLCTTQAILLSSQRREHVQCS